MTINFDRDEFIFVADGFPRLENYRELKTQKFHKHKYDRRYPLLPCLSRSRFQNRNWPKWYLQSFLLGVPILFLGNRSKRNLLTSTKTMSMEDLLRTTVSNSPDFDRALALGRIHNILSALIEHCRTRAGYLYTGCFTCELQIRSEGNVYVPPVPPNNEVRAELRRAWELIQAVDVPYGTLIFPPLPPLVSEPQQLGPTIIAEHFIAPDTFQPRVPPPNLLSRAIVAPFALYCAFSICYEIYVKILPIATLIFQVIFFFHFVAIALVFSVILCSMILASR